MNLFDRLEQFARSAETDYHETFVIAESKASLDQISRESGKLAYFKGTPAYENLTEAFANQGIATGIRFAISFLAEETGTNDS